MTSPAVQQLTSQFVAQLEEMVLNAIGVQSIIRDATPQLNEHFNCRSIAVPLSVEAPVMVRRMRRKAPVQLCPAPGCLNRAAPSLGMVCSAHTKATKATVRKWREERRARKAQQRL